MNLHLPLDVAIYCLAAQSATSQMGSAQRSWLVALEDGLFFGQLASS
jgi:hypothetical protein